MASFDLYFGGAEQQGWRRLLAEQGAPMALSFRGLLRRMPKSKPWMLAEKLAGEYPVLLDSGAHSFNTKKDPGTAEELERFARTYEAFVEANTDRPTLISEFDSVHLGIDWVFDRREQFYDHLEPAQFMPVWHSDWGIPVLKDMASRYEVIGITATETTTGSNLTPVLHQIARSGVRLHGIALTKPDILRTMPFASAASTSWLSPSQYGDTIVWDGQTLHRYPRDYKERARRQHRMLMERAGFDADLIEADDVTEVLRFTIWSWLQQAEAIRTIRYRTGRVGITVDDEVTVGFDAQPGSASDANGENATVTNLPAARKSRERVRVTNVVERGERQLLPGVLNKVVTSKDTDADGVAHEISTEFFGVASEVTRVCDNCFVQDVCPLFQPQTRCAYDIPVSAETADQRKAIMKGIIEMQTQRVAFLRAAEEMNGGYADPNLSGEMDRLKNLMLAQHEIEDDRDTFEMSIRAKGGKIGMLDRVFGREEPPRHGQVIEVDPLRGVDAKVPLH